MSNYLIGFLAISGTVAAYLFAKWLYRRIYITLFLPIAVATLLIIIVLSLTGTSYEMYMLGGGWIHKLLGPAVVALAYPLYQQRDILKELIVPIVFGVFVGAVIGVVTGIILAKWLGIDREIIYSLIPKSVTTPVAMEISLSLGGIEALAAVFVMIAGISGAMMSPYLYKYCRIHHPIGRGIGLGCASHAIGTAKALESSQLEGSLSTIAMIISAVFVSIITPFFVTWLM